MEHKVENRMGNTKKRRINSKNNSNRNSKQAAIGPSISSSSLNNEQSFIYRLEPNTILYHSKKIYGTNHNETLSKTFSFPIFFTLNIDIAEIYNKVNPGNKCQVYNNNTHKNLLNISAKIGNIDNIFSFKTDTRFIHKTIIDSILKIFFGNANNIYEIIQAIYHLKNESLHSEILGLLQYFNRNKKYFAGFLETAYTTMIKTLDDLLTKINIYRKLKIIPVRTSERNFDLFLCNLLKLTVNDIDGFIFFNNRNTELSDNSVTLNSLYKHRQITRDREKVVDLIVPDELCLFNGYTGLELLGPCRTTNTTGLGASR